MTVEGSTLRRKPRVAVLGAGIRGASIAAMLAATGDCAVVLIERGRPGAGTSATNHGRFHSGTWNYPENDREIVRRNGASRRLIERLPGVIVSRATGYYFVEDAGAVEPFVRFCDEHNILDRDALRGRPSPNRIYRPWLKPHTYAAAFDIPEFAFNPAHLAARLARYVEETEDCRLVRRRVMALRRVGDGFGLDLDGGETVEADVVVNALGRWINDLASDLALPRLPIAWERWRLLCVRCHDLGPRPPGRVVTIQSASGAAFAAIPHGPWLVLGCDVERERLDSPEDLPAEAVWRDRSRWRGDDEELFRPLAERFPVLRALERERPACLFTFSGVLPVVPGERSVTGIPAPYAIVRVYEAAEAPGYWSLFGGSATTALIDAAEITDRACDHLTLQRQDGLELVRDRIAPRLPTTVPGAGMIWEQQAGA